MLSKENFLKIFGDTSDSLEKLYSAYVISVKNERVVITSEFYDKFILDLLVKFSLVLGLNVCGYGFVDDAEKVLIAFGKCCIDESLVFESAAKVLRISYNDKFNKLSHRDFLGSIMSLGFAREKIGDLVLEGNCAYVPVVVDFVEYIVQNLKKVRNVCVNIDIELFNKLPRKNFEILYKVVGSLRIDVMVSALINFSRENSKKLIKGSKVKLNGCVELNVDTKVCEGDIITVVGYGKFKVKENLGSTAKNKIRVIVDKFI